MTKYSFERDIEQAVAQSWTIPHNDYTITVKNEAMCERLYINDELVVENQHHSLLTTFNPIQKLKYTYDRGYGRPDEIVVTIGGLIAINVKIKVNGEVIFKDKLSLFK